MAYPMNSFEPQGVENRQRVMTELTDGIGPAAEHAATLATRIIAHHAEMPLQRRHLLVEQMQIGAECVRQNHRGSIRVTFDDDVERLACNDHFGHRAPWKRSIFAPIFCLQISTLVR